MPINSYRDLLVWQRAMSLVEGVYRVAEAMPVVERYILAAELKKTSISLPSNIAEGRGRGRTGDFINHLIIALGSEAELQTQLELAVRLQLAPVARAKPLIDDCAEVGRMLNGLLASLEARVGDRRKRR
jgi:four helix bundle protein